MPLPSDRSGLVAELHALAAADAQAGVGLSLDEWIAVLNVHSTPFSLRRALFLKGPAPEDATLQLHCLSSGLAAVPEHAEIAARIRAMPLRQQIAVLDTVDRFWSREDDAPMDLRETLEGLGVVLVESAHDRLRAAARARCS